LTEFAGAHGGPLYGDYPEEIDGRIRRIRRNVEEADAAEAAWRREQAALA